MAYWEFLLQQAGDEGWLPLETSHVEILAGRYRIVAHTSHRDQAAEIYLVQPPEDNIPTRAFRREGRVNRDGLLAVMPFTTLGPGSWQIRCRSLEPEAPPWDYGVELQVVPVGVDPDGWAPDLDGPEEEAAIDRFLQGQDPALGPLPTPSTPIPPVDLNQPQGQVPLRIRLPQQAWMATQGVPVPIQGQLVNLAGSPQVIPPGVTLWVQLRNPETGEVLRRWGQPVPSGTDTFSLTLVPPTVADTRLLVGELSLWQGQPPQAIALQGFTLAINLDSLLSAVAHQEEGSAQATPTTPLTLPTTVPPHREIPFTTTYRPKAGFTLPPQIRPASSTPRPASAAPQLPPWSSQRAVPTPTAPLPRLDLPQFSPRPPTPKTVAEALATAPETAPPSSDPAAGEVAPASLDPSTQEEMPPEVGTPAHGESQGDADQEFQSLDLQGRFWSRLSALTYGGQIAAVQKLRQDIAAAGVSLPFETPPPPPSPPDPTHEVVIYDTPEPPPPGVEGPSSTAEEPPGADLPPDLPAPTLLLPPGDLVGGTPLIVRVQMPLLAQRLGVKFWITDLQSRRPVERPRWLMTWTTTAAVQEALVQVPVPLGCVEVLFEAIAVDLDTEQESRKTSILRVLSPSLGE